MVTECNKVVSEQGFTDPYALPPVLTALEGTIHLFQLHYATNSTKENQIYILDTVMETGPHLLIQPEEHAPANLAVEESENETLILTGPKTDTQTGTQSPLIPMTGNTPQASIPVTPEIVTDAQNHPQVNEAENPLIETQVLETAICTTTPPTTATAESSTLVTVENITTVHKDYEKIEVGKRSVRRQLLKEGTEKETQTPAKKSKQQE